MSLFQMIEDTLIQNSSSEFMVMFDNERTKEIGTQTESKKLIDKTVGNSKKMLNKSTQYTLTNIPFAEEVVLQPLKVKFRPKAKPKFKDTGVNTDSFNKPNFDNDLNYGSETESEYSSDPLDPSFHVSQEEYNTEETNDNDKDDEEETDLIKEPSSDSTFMVYWSQQSTLLPDCFICNLSANICKIRQQGIIIEVNLECIKNHITTWYSSPTIKRMTEANLTLSTAILYSGNTFGRIREMMQIGNVAFLGQTYYYKTQKQILFPVVNQVNRTEILSTLKSNKVKLVGDGRSDSPGYNAKYGTYIVMDKETKNVFRRTCCLCSQFIPYGEIRTYKQPEIY